MNWKKQSVVMEDLGIPAKNKTGNNIMIYKSTNLKTILYILLIILSVKGSYIHADNSDRKFDFYFYEALNAKALGKYDQAIDLFRHCYSIDSTNANVLIELGTFYNALQEKDLALNYIRKAVYYDQSNFYYNMMLAGISRELGMKQEVVDIYTHLQNIYPEKPELHFELANAYADNGELDKAIDALNELEKSVGVSEALALNKFRLYSMMDNKEKAFEEIQNIIDKNPNDIRYLVLMGDLYMEDNQQDKALSYYRLAEKVDSSYPALIISMVSYFEKTGNKEAAQIELQKAITSTSMEVENKLQLVTRYLGVLQQSNQDLKQANPLFESLFLQHPNYTELNLIYGNLLYMQEDKEGALEQFEKYIEGNPDNPAGYENVIRVALPDEDMEAVKDVTTRALKHLPEEPQFYYYLGAVNFQEENYEEALRIFEEGLEKAVFRNPILESDFYGQIGDLNHYLGNEEVAFDNYEKALQLYPQNLPVLNNYSYYLSLQKRELDKAEKMSGITIKAEPMNPTYLDTYGWVLYVQESYIMAKIYIEKAIEYGADNPSAEVHEHYGDVLYKTGEEEKAMEYWIKARELGDNSELLDKKIETGKLIESL